MSKLTIIIPSFNEEKTIDQVLNNVYNLSLPGKYKKEIIVVDDGSSDKTLIKIDSWIKKGIVILKHSKNRGKGAAVKTGLSKAKGELILIQDADLEYNPVYYLDLLEPFKDNNVQVVYGTRLLKYPLNLWGEDKSVLPLHLIANRFLTILTNILYGSKLTDMETGYKIFRKKILEDIEIESEGFDFEPEITAKVLKKGAKILEVPIKTVPRNYSEGKKIGWRDGFVAIWTLIKYRINRS